MTPPQPALASNWQLAPGVAYLNHGSFGACPAAVLTAQHALRARAEANLMAFYSRDLPELVEAARRRVSAFLEADPEGLVFVPNATTGVNTVLASLAPTLAPGDEILLTNHGYGACRNAALAVAARCGARVVTAQVPFPIEGPDQVVRAVLGAVTERTRLALLDHVTSPTALVFPIEQLVAALDQRGVDTLVDGAHAPGMVEVALDRLGAAYWTGNAHKWLCAPKGAAMLWVRRDRRALMRPLVVSHGASVRRPEELRDEFDWTGTDDPTPFLSIPAALDTLAGLVPGGWAEVRARNHELVVAGRERLLTALGGQAAAPATMLGSIATVVLPDSTQAPASIFTGDPLQAELAELGIEVPVWSWPQWPRRILRISAQLYNTPAEYDRLAVALAERLRRPEEPNDSGAGGGENS